MALSFQYSNSSSTEENSLRSSSLSVMAQYGWGRVKLNYEFAHNYKRAVRVRTQVIPKCPFNITSHRDLILPSPPPPLSLFAFHFTFFLVYYLTLTSVFGILITRNR